jgi:hypothetical protein
MTVSCKVTSPIQNVLGKTLQKHVLPEWQINIMQVSSDICLITLSFLCTESLREAFRPARGLQHGVIQSQPIFLYYYKEIQPVIRFCYSCASPRRSVYCVLMATLQPMDTNNEGVQSNLVLASTFALLS